MRKKLTVALVSSAVIAFGKKLGLDEVQIQNITYIILAYLGAQGVADIKKG